MVTESKTALAPEDVVREALEEYAARGVFRGFSCGPVRNGKASFKMMWHRDQMFEFLVDLEKGTLRFPLVLPGVPADSSMYKEFKAFLKSRQDEDLLEHRRIDKARAELKPYNRGGNVSVTLKIKDGDYAYGTQRLINLVHEIYLVFLYDGRYYDYLVETFDLDPDQP